MVQIFGDKGNAPAKVVLSFLEIDVFDICTQFMLTDRKISVR